MQDDMPGAGMAAIAVSYGLLVHLRSKGVIDYSNAERILEVALSSLEKHPPDNPVVILSTAA